MLQTAALPPQPPHTRQFHAALAAKSGYQIALAYLAPPRTLWTAFVTPDHAPAIRANLRDPSLCDGIVDAAASVDGFSF
jgi:hypothetical protein